MCKVLRCIVISVAVCIVVEATCIKENLVLAKSRGRIPCLVTKFEQPRVEPADSRCRAHL